MTDEPLCNRKRATRDGDRVPCEMPESWHTFREAGFREGYGLSPDYTHHAYHSDAPVDNGKP